MSTEVADKLLELISKVSKHAIEADTGMMQIIGKLTDIVTDLVADVQLQEARISALEAERE